MREDTARNLLTALLDCGSDDLRILDSCEYGFHEVIEEARGYKDHPDINDLCSAMFTLAKHDINDWLVNRLGEIHVDLMNGDKHTAEYVYLTFEYKTLSELSPHEDISSYHNFLDTHVYLSCNEEKGIAYARYCKEAIDAFEQKTGFPIDLPAITNEGVEHLYDEEWGGVIRVEREASLEVGDPVVAMDRNADLIRRNDKSIVIGYVESISKEGRVKCSGLPAGSWAGDVILKVTERGTLEEC